MNHYATSNFWDCYNKLPEQVQKRADKSFDLLNNNPNHPSLYLKKIKDFWSVRVGLYYRALAVESENGKNLIWFWIGNHDDYERMIDQN